MELERVHPWESKLFHGDVFRIDPDTKKPVIVQSEIRNTAEIPGVLVLHNNKTYGRNERGRLLYKCIPDDIHIPSFLIPYEMKNIGFSKVFSNLYVTFSFVEWRDKHPRGLLSKTIGAVDVLSHYYEYQLHCKGLNHSIQKMTKDTYKAMQSTPDLFQMYPGMEDRTFMKVITIDRINSKDYDDGIGLQVIDTKTSVLSVYISNVTIWMDGLKLWDSFSNRVSTIYMPDNRHPMLPTLLSEGVCSLQENTVRYALAMDLVLSEGEIQEVRFVRCKIRVYKNYEYEEARLCQDESYQTILTEVQRMANKNGSRRVVRDSHELVEYMMILMNYYTALECMKHKVGIFRSTVIRKTEEPTGLPSEICEFIKIWKGTTGQYINGSREVMRRHESLDLDAYIHITSPIRRLVDLLNMIAFHKIKGFGLSDKANVFYNQWIERLEEINRAMKATRRVQTDCQWLATCMNHPERMEKEYEGYLFDKVERKDGLFEYVVYLPTFKMVSKIVTRENRMEYEKHGFRLYMFWHEEKFKKKIRLQMVE